MNFPVVCAIFFFAHCFYIINGGPAYFNLETLEVSHRSDLFVPGEDYTGKHEFFLYLFWITRWVHYPKEIVFVNLQVCCFWTLEP